MVVLAGYFFNLWLVPSHEKADRSSNSFRWQVYTPSGVKKGAHAGQKGRHPGWINFLQSVFLVWSEKKKNKKSDLVNHIESRLDPRRPTPPPRKNKNGLRNNLAVKCSSIITQTAWKKKMKQQGTATLGRATRLVDHFGCRFIFVTSIFFLCLTHALAREENVKCPP